MKQKSPESRKSLIDKGFDIDRRLNIAVGIGATAVAILVPPLAAPAALVAGGSIAAIPINDRLKRSIDKRTK
ncbi:hypothetical protein GX865_02705 [Candidatus Saccharibacteria bacterium]|jgi:hypothetical protein|nr:hypothetical protein [Candidatus Saccharibacteria bacterium]